MRRRKLIPALLVAGAVVLVAVGIGADSLGLTCSFDPTDECNWSVVVVANDLDQPVVLRECMHHCGTGDQRLDGVPVPFGTRSPATQDGGITALIGESNWIAVESAGGATLGCLVLDGHAEKRDGDLVRASQMGECGDATTKPLVPVGRVSDEP